MDDGEKRNEGSELRESTEPQILLSQSEQAVLSVFRRYLMSPGKMLCFSNPQLASFTESLTQLTDKGLLIQESFPGAYSLTESGFAAMNDGV